MFLLEGNHVARTHDSLILASALSNAHASHRAVPQVAFIFGKLEVCFRLPWPKVRSQPQVLIDRKGINYLPRIHFVLRIPNGLEFTESVYQFGTKHLGQHLGLGLPIPMFTGNRAAIAHDKIGGVFDECAIVANSLYRTEIEVDARMNAALTKMSIERAIVAVLFKQAAQIPQVVPHLLGRHRRILPAFPCNRLSRYKGGGSEPRLTNLPYQLLLALIIV